MSTKLHKRIKRAREAARRFAGDRPARLDELNNIRVKDWGLVNGQLARFQGNKLVEFVRMGLRLSSQERALERPNERPKDGGVVLRSAQ